jgi:small conductance mechanosensitive channel
MEIIKNQYNMITTYISNNLFNIILGITILLFSLYLAFYYYKIISHKQNIKNNTNKNLLYYELSYSIYYLIIIVGALVSLIIMGVNTGTIIALIGSIGVATALAAQGTLNNLIGGIYVIINNFFNIGDIITVNNITGKVTKFNLFTTTIVDNIGNSYIIPNLMIQNNIMGLNRIKQ